MAATTSTGRASREPAYIEEPAFSRWLFGSSKAGWIWLVARFLLPKLGTPWRRGELFTGPPTTRT